MTSSKKTTIKGSECVAQHDARPIGPIDPHQPMEISVYLKPRRALTMDKDTIRNLSPDDFARQYGADSAQINQIKQFAREFNLQMLERGDETNRRAVTLAGTAAAMEKAFSIELNEYDYPNGTYRGYAGSVQVPEQYASMIQSVFGLENRPQAQPYFRARSRQSGTFGTRASNVSFSGAEVAHLYDFPPDANGKGQTIGMIELGGGYRPVDIQEYFRELKLPVPTVKAVSVDHAQNRPTTSRSSDGQVALDIEVAAAVAQGVNIIVYFAPNTARGFVDAMSLAVHDQLNRPTVVSVGWGSLESNWAPQAMETINQVAQEAALLGVTITASAGNNGSNGGVDGGRTQVNFPASSPFILACGGTRLVTKNGAIENESVWNDGLGGGVTGGGYSSVFGRPAWQTAVASHPGRGLPDVAANAAPETGYDVLVDGEWRVIGGTGAVAPLWAGLVVLINQKLHTRLGLVAPYLYSLGQSSGFRDITVGSNGAFSATPGWDPTTGRGSPSGNQLLQALSKMTAQSGAQAKVESRQHEHSAAK